MSVPSEIAGWHQSDVIIRSALQKALADLRSKPFLLDYVFASLAKDDLTKGVYGQKEIDNAKKWFLSTNIPVFMNTRFDEAKLPAITIGLIESSESELTLGDLHYIPQQIDLSVHPALTRPFTPVSYNSAQGALQLPNDLELIVVPGMVLVDSTGALHEILEVLDDVNIRIAPNQTVSFNNTVIKGQKPGRIVEIESVVMKETYSIGCHTGGEQSQLTYLHSIVSWCLLRYKQELLEARGFERSQISSTDFRRNEGFEDQLAYSRHIQIFGFVRQSWPKGFRSLITSASTSVAFNQFGARWDQTLVGAPYDEDQDSLLSSVTSVTTPDALPAAPYVFNGGVSEDRLLALEATVTNSASALGGHLTATVDAHDASAISIIPITGITATNVQNTLEEHILNSAIHSSDSSALTNHLASSSAHAASSITVAPIVGYFTTPTNTQTALATIFADLTAKSTSIASANTRLTALETDGVVTNDRITNLTASQIAMDPVANYSFIPLNLQAGITEAFFEIEVANQRIVNATNTASSALAAHTTQVLAAHFASQIFVEAIPGIVGASVQEVLAEIFAAAGSSAAITDLTNRVTAAEAAATALTTRVTATETSIVSLQAADTVFGTRATAIESAATALTTRVTATETAATALTTRVTATETAATALTTRVTTAEGAIASQGTRLTTAETNITSLQAADTAFGTRATAIETAATALTTRVTTAETNVTALQAADTAFGTRATAIESAATALTTRVTNAETAATALTTRVTTAEGAIASQGTRLTTAEGDIDALQAADTAQTAALNAHLDDTVDAHDASAISVAAITGLTAVDVQAAIAEHQTEIDADVAALASHVAQTIAHGATGAVVGTTNAQTLFNKTHSGTFPVTGVAANANSITIGTNTRLSFGGTSYLTSTDGTDLLSALAFFAPTFRSTTTAELIGQVADAATAVAVKLRSNVSYVTAGSKLVSVQNATTEKAFFDKDGGLTVTGVPTGANAIAVPDQTRINFGTASGNLYRAPGAGLVTDASLRAVGGFISGSGMYSSASGMPTVFQGAPANNATAIATKVQPSVALTVDGALILAGYSDAGITQSFYVDKDGVYGGAGNAYKVVTVSANYTATRLETYIHVNAAAGPVTVTLPPAAAVGMTGRAYYIKKTDTTTNFVIVDPNGAELIDGSATAEIVQPRQSIQIVSDGTSWFIH